MSDSATYRADWVLPSKHPPIRDGVVEVQLGRINRVAKFREGESVIDLGHVAIIPGLVNAHTHLEFSHLDQPLGHPGIQFTEWVKLVVADRIGKANDLLTSIEKGIVESIRCGTVGLGEIASSDWLKSIDSTSIYGEFLRQHLFLERLGNDSAYHEKLVEGGREFLSKNDDGFLFGLSPHAPYSVPLELLDSLMHIANQKNSAVAMHLAETREELEFLNHGTGSFKDLLDFLNASRTHQPNRGLVCDYLESLSKSNRCLIIHGNYLARPEIEMIAAMSNTTIVFCPRTHSFFQHDDYPLKEFLNAKINVAIGTDSRASNPDLSIWKELQLIAKDFPDVDRQTILRMGTANGALALNFEKTLGEIEAGKSANLLTVPLQTNSVNESDPYAMILDNRAATDHAGCWPSPLLAESMPSCLRSD